MNFAAYEDELLEYGAKALESIGGLRIIGTSPRKAGILSFVIDNIHPHDIGTILDTLRASPSVPATTAPSP